MNKNYIFGGIVAIVLIVLGMFSLQGIKSCSGGKNYGNTISTEVHSAQNKIHDTIRKYDTIKQKAEVRYKTQHDTLWVMPPINIDSLFDKTYPRDSADTTNFYNGYTQLRKAVDEHNKRIRDSIKETASVAQVKTCTTVVSDVVKKVDSVVPKIEPTPDPVLTPTRVTIGALLIAFIAFVSGSLAN